MKHIFQKIILICLIAFPTSSFAQLGGFATFQSLEISASPFSSALGGKIISNNYSIETIFLNPALLNPKQNYSLSLTYKNYLAGINIGQMITTLYSSKKYGSVAFGIKYLNYGKFDLYDQAENYYGTFTAADYIPILTYSFQIDSQLSVGISFKPVFSQLEKYKSYGFAFDFGILFKATPNITFAAALRNQGKQLKPYYQTIEPLPKNFSLGLTLHPSLSPFIFNITLEYLNRWNISYSSPLNKLYLPPYVDTTSFVYKLGQISDQILRHAHFGLQILLSKHLQILLGYDYRRAVELSIPTARTFNGLSFGLLIQTPKLSLDYSLEKFLTFSTQTFGICLKLNQIYYSLAKVKKH